jgi:hypothetical protein
MGDATIDDKIEANGLREKVATDLKALKINTNSWSPTSPNNTCNGIMLKT